jgi:short-subunit dehydrogenase involved in D-alanine esterification of teichoic acids
MSLDWPATFKGAVYCATKAFFHSFTISMRHLLVEVIEMNPQH